MITFKKINRSLGLPVLVLGLIAGSCSLDIDETDSLITEGGSDVFNGVENPAGSIDAIYHIISGQI